MPGSAGYAGGFCGYWLARAAFLHLSDLCARDLEKKGSENIEHYLHEGQHVVVQVVKDPLGSKGARITTEISIPSRFQVYMPYANNSGVSQRIECEAERVRLRTCLDAFRQEHKCGGFIARTAAECAEESVLIADMAFLLKLWESITDKIASAKPKQFIHKDLPLSVRTLRDLYQEGIERIRVDSKETYHKLLEFAEIFVPEIVPVIEHYSGECPVFDIYSVEDEIRKALERKVKLKSGGHLVFDQTEAMTTVDVNTGGYVAGVIWKKLSSNQS